MTEIVACVLALDGLIAAERTNASFHRFGLPVVIGVADGDEDPHLPGGKVHRIDWREDLADARNQLAAKVDADWLLWIDPDEELATFDATRIDGLEGPVAAVWLRGISMPSRCLSWENP